MNTKTYKFDKNKQIAEKFDKAIIIPAHETKNLLLKLFGAGGAFEIKPWRRTHYRISIKEVGESCMHECLVNNGYLAYVFTLNE